MKKLLAFVFALFACVSARAVGECDLIIRQLDAWGNEVPRVAAVPTGCTGSNGFLVYDINTAQPRIFRFDGTLLFNSGIVGVGPLSIAQITGLAAALASKFDSPAGTTLQYVRGDGSLATLPGSSVFSVSDPTSRSLSLSTAYQCTDTTKPCTMTVTVACPLTLSILAGATCAGEFRVGSTNNVATGGGTNIAPIQRNASGILGLSTNDYETKTVRIGVGRYFAIRQTTGSGLSIVAAFDQSESN